MRFKRGEMGSRNNDWAVVVDPVEALLVVVVVIVIHFLRSTRLSELVVTTVCDVVFLNVTNEIPSLKIHYR